jgi:tetratricopeptide (TPR) repeat protein
LAQYFYNKREFENALGAIDELEKANKPSPLSFQMKALIYEGLEDEFNALLNWGFCEKLQGKAEEAIMQFQSAYNVNPKNKDAAVELAKLYEQTGESFVAIEFWQKVYEIDEDKNAKEILADFYHKQGDLKMAEKYGKVIEKKETAQIEYIQSGEEDEGLLNKIINFFSKK